MKNKWTWYFAFGEQKKSSLLNQYSREFSLPYIQKLKHSKDLELYKQKTCIIEGGIQTLKSWQALIPNIELIFIGQNFKQEQLKVKYQYLQIGKCWNYPSFENYESFRRYLSPNLIFFYGPNRQYCQGAAATIAYQISYFYMQTLPQSANKMISQLKLGQNYTFSNIFMSLNDLKILQSRFNLKIIHFKHNKNEFPKMEQYFNQQSLILNYLSGKEHFWSVDASQRPQKIMDRIGEILCPELIFISANNKTQKDYVENYCRNQNTVYLSIFEIQSINKRKNIPLAYTLKQKILLLNSIIYKDFALKRIVLVDFPFHVDEIRMFEQLNRKFTNYVQLDSPQSWSYSKKYTTPFYFLETQRLSRPDINFSLSQQITKINKYWVVIGPQAAGKTTAAKCMAQRYGMKLIEVQSYMTQLKEKLITPEDGEQLPIHKIISHFEQLFHSSQQKEFIFDGFPCDPKKWTKNIGNPHLIHLKVDLNELIKRQRKKNEADLNAQISEEESTKASQSIAEAQRLGESFIESLGETVSYNIDFNSTIIQSQKLLSSVYEPKVFLIQSMPTLLYHNIALKYNCGFYNLAIHSLDQIKRFVKKDNKRNIIIFGYQHTEGNTVSQDLYAIEKDIGKIRYLSIWNGQNKSFDEEYLQLEKPIDEKPKKVLQQGEEENEQPPAEEQSQEQKKKPLDIYAYKWTKPVCHKNLTQWYLKLKKSVQQSENNEKQTYRGFGDKLKRINQDPKVNIYQVVVSNQKGAVLGEQL